MMIAIEATEGITYDFEFVRHFEIIPGEESPLEVHSCHLSTNFASPIDLVRKFNV